ncbi:MAG TPA: IPT/TIG domain-containing protein [Thermoanaerobaculia bacterium]|nr:IPT/TIG domain-containing protein [Thermoanaerobaculia bacterium]
MRLFLATLTFVATSTTAVLASPKITSVTPGTGDVTGGTTVIIRGTGFSNNCIICSPPFADPDVHFGNSRAQSVRFIDETTLEAVTPPHMPEVEQELLTDCSQATGRIFFVSKGHDKDLAGNIRVRDVTRQASSHGVEVPVVHRSEFTEETISLLGVPIDPRFRNTLRIYGLERGENFVNVTVGGTLHQLPLVGTSDLFTPAVITFTDFPQAALTGALTTITVTVDAPRGAEGVGTPIWAFISVTNNETQEITTITPNLRLEGGRLVRHWGGRDVRPPQELNDTQMIATITPQR